MRHVSNSPRSLRLARLSPLLSLLTLGACASVLGIEDVHEGPAPGAGGDEAAAASNQGGSREPTGATSNGGSSSAGGGSGDAGEGPVVGGAPAGGSGPVADAGAPGEGGAGGEAPQDPTVHGRVIDFWGKTLPNVTLQIGEQLLTTDDNGEFTAEDVPEEYDVSLLIRPEGRDYGWVFQGLTRRNPTLQVYEGRNSRSGTVVLKSTNITLGANDTVSVGLGTPDGSEDFSEVSTDSGGSTRYPDWFGLPTTQGTAHALAWTYNAATNRPTAYRAYDSSLLALSNSQSTTLTFDLTPSAVPSGPLAGLVKPYADGDRNNNLFVRFTSGAGIMLVDETPPANEFSYVVPTLPQASITVSAYEGYYYGPMGLVHKDGLAAGGSDVELEIPAPAEPLTPNGSDGVDQDTTFSFKPSPDNAGAYVVSLENSDYYQTLYIVTSKTQFKIPTVVGGAFELDPNQEFRWRVETHGDFASVDEMTASTGFMDSFSWLWTAPAGPRQGDGSFTLSGAYLFTTAP